MNFKLNYGFFNRDFFIFAQYAINLLQRKLFSTHFKMNWIEEVWNFAVKHTDQFMDCLIVTNEGREFFTNRCFLQNLTKTMKIKLPGSENENSILKVLMPDHSEAEVKKLLDGFVITSSFNDKDEQEDSLTPFNNICHDANLPVPESYKLSQQESIVEVQSLDDVNNELGSHFKNKKHSKIFEDNKSTNKKKSFLCHYCGKDCKTSIKLKKHKYQVHPATEGTNVCNICSKSLKTKSSLHNHMLTHSEAKFNCEQCFRVGIVKTPIQLKLIHSYISVSLE